MEKEITFCGNGRCCPVVVASDKDVTFLDNGQKISSMSREEFTEFVTAAKRGVFDELI